MRTVILALLLSPLLCSQASSQTTQAELSARLVGKPLLLRGFWAADKLQFDARGQPAQVYPTESFTLCGMDVTNVESSRGKLLLKGQRVQLVFAPDGAITREPLKLGASPKGKPEQIDIEIAAVPSADVLPALDAIFAEKIADIAPSLPSYWQSYAQHHLLQEKTADKLSDIDSRNERALHIGGSVKPPKVLHGVDPAFTDAARQRNFSGQVLVYLWCESDGTPSHIAIAKPVGMGLDEEAIAAVSQYRFAPATQNGASVKVDLYIGVHFQLLPKR